MWDEDKTVFLKNQEFIRNIYFNSLNENEILKSRQKSCCWRKYDII